MYWKHRLSYLVIICLVATGLLLSFRLDIINSLAHPPNVWEDGGHKLTNPWVGTPPLELNIRLTTTIPRTYDYYSGAFLTSARIFWPSLQNLTVVMDKERHSDHVLGEKVSQMWPYPRVVYLDRPSDVVDKFGSARERKRMFYDMFFPEEYTHAEYIGFVDTDTMFVTMVSPQSLFHNGRPIVNGIIGNMHGQYREWETYVRVLLHTKDVMDCMSYFPVIMKVSHIVEMRKHIENLHGKDFASILRDSPRDILGGTCQHCVYCNYVWEHHRDEYEFHLQMTPDNKWKYLPNVQVDTVDPYTIPDQHKVPFPGVAVHARHLMINGVFHSGLNNFADNIHNLEERLKEGICYTFRNYMCLSKYCAQYDLKAIQKTLYQFENFVWHTWDGARCLAAQKKHYEHVERLVDYNLRRQVWSASLKETRFRNVSSHCDVLLDTHVKKP